MPTRVQKQIGAVDRLQHDHTRLRQILAFVGGTLHVGAPARPILQDACVALTGQLEQHIVREKLLHTRSMTQIRKEVPERRIPNHRQQARQLRVLSHNLLVHKNVMPQNIDAALYAIIETLHQQMEEQEEWLIPSVSIKLPP